MKFYPNYNPSKLCPVCEWEHNDYIIPVVEVNWLAWVNCNICRQIDRRKQSGKVRIIPL